jgi:septal ring factor EnvC (AmiA/AmiB activator)
LVPALGRAQSELNQQLSDINAQIEAQSGRVEELKVNIQKLQGEARVLKGALDKLKGQESSLNNSLKSSKTQVENVQRELERTDAEINRTQGLSLQRMRALYMSQNPSLMEQLLLIRDSSNMFQHALFVQRLRKFDLELMRKLAELRSVRALQQTMLEREISKKDQVLAKLTTQRQAAKVEYDKQDNLVKSLDRERRNLEENIISLKAQALRLETVVASLTNADSGGENTGAAPVEPSVGPLTAFRGQGLSALKGELDSPFVGRVLRGFGKYRNSELGTIVLSKGVDFDGPSAGEVRAVAPGAVIFSGKMPVYGNIVILDHGKREYSLYGRLGASSVRQGQSVQASQILGRVGDSDPANGNFYFEIRRGGKPINPQNYFGNRLGK